MCSYWEGVLRGHYFIAGLPAYRLPFLSLPGWLLQTLEFYPLLSCGNASFGEELIGGILALAFICVIVVGLKRRRAGLVLAVLALIFAAQALYTSSSHNCSYCTDRAALPIAPLGAALLALGVGALATAPTRWLRWGAVAVAIVALVAVGSRTFQERRRVADVGYFLDAANGGLLGHLPSRAGPVDLEGYGDNPIVAPGELALVYYLASERNHEQVSVPTEYDNDAALVYLGGANPKNSQFNPRYRYVLTRFRGVQTGRKVIAWTDGLALEERTAPLDATVVSGVAVPFLRQEAVGLPWVVGPLHMLVVGGGSGPAWVALRFHKAVPVTVAPSPDVTARVTPALVTACVRATGKAPVRKATVSLRASLTPGIVPAEPYGLEEPPGGIQLIAMEAVSHCSLSGAG